MENIKIILGLIVFSILILGVTSISSVDAVLSDTAYKDPSYKIKSKYYDVLRELEVGIKLSENSLSGISFENSDAKEKLDSAWKIRYMVWQYIGEGKNILNDAESYLKDQNYQKAWEKLHQFDLQLSKAKSHISAITTELKEGKELEEQYQEKNKTCILFWCNVKDTTQGLDFKIKDLELKVEKIKNKQKDITSEYQSVIQNQKLTIQKIESKQEQERLSEQNRQTELRAMKEQQRLEEQKQRELNNQRIQAEQERQRLELQKQRELTSQRIQAEQDQLRLEEQKQRELYNQRIQAEQEEQRLAEQIELKEKQRIMEQARTNPVLQGIIDGQLYFYIQPIPSYYKVPGIHEGVENIASSLERDFYGTEIRRTYNESSADIVIMWVKDFGSSTLGHAIFKKYVEVELGSDNCWGDWQPYTVSSIKKVMWHEIGHSLGYGHSSDTRNVMYKSTNPQLYQSVSHTFDLEGGYSQWFSFCNSGAISFHAESSRDTDGFNAYAIPPDDPRGFSNNGGSTYMTNDGSSCGANNMQWLTRYCNVGQGAYLHFKNTESHTIYITFEMYDKNQRDWPNMTWDQNAFQYDSSYLYKVYDMFH